MGRANLRIKEECSQLSMSLAGTKGDWFCPNCVEDTCSLLERPSEKADWVLFVTVSNSQASGCDSDSYSDSDNNSDGDSDSDSGSNHSGVA